MRRVIGFSGQYTESYCPPERAIPRNTDRLRRALIGRSTDNPHVTCNNMLSFHPLYLYCIVHTTEQQGQSRLVCCYFCIFCIVFYYFTWAFPTDRKFKHITCLLPSDGQSASTCTRAEIVCIAWTTAWQCPASMLRSTVTSNALHAC